VADRDDIYRKAPALAVADALGRAQAEKEAEITSRGLDKHPALVGDPQPSFGFGLAPRLSTGGGQVKYVDGQREIVGGTGDSVVDFFLALLDTQLSESRHQKDESRRMLARTTWATLRNAAIIKIPGELYGVFYHMADRYTTERVSGQEWAGQHEPPLEKPMTGRTFYEGVNKLGKHEPLPERRPFDCIYFGYEPKVRVNQDLATLYGLHKVAEEGILKQFALGGHLVAPDSVMACLMLELHMKDDDGTPKLVGGTSMMMERHLGEWNAPYTLAPWIIPSLIRWVNEHKTVVEDTRGLSYRLGVKKWAKKNKIKRLPPPPYYTVRMHDKTLKETAKQGFVSRYKECYEYNHRWTVRGHYMVRVRRGSLPMDSELELKLRNRKYKIFIHDGPDMETWQHLRNRGIQPKRVDEWMAVLVSWRRDYVKGPEDKPLIPSVRKSGRKKVSNG
jgi:hypothetical protein